MLYWNTFLKSVIETCIWIKEMILFEVPIHLNSFWGLVMVSLIVWGLEIFFPWRKNQAIFRKDFWLDTFYMFFNFYIFYIFLSGFYAVTELAFSEIGISMTSITLLDLSSLPTWAQLIIFFLLFDFVQWFTHVLLHRIPILWEFHKVHHSVKEMGFAAHLRYHWMENILYKPLKTLAVMLLGGFMPEHAFITYFIMKCIGHLNHANIKLTYGPLKYLLNNPVMHLYHHAYSLPSNRKHGVNFGISLSIWDYIFGTNYIPEDSGTIEIGFDGDEKFPKSFWGQFVSGFGKT